MNKELQDLAWSVLPKEFKKEVRKEYAKCAAIDIDDNPNLPAYAVESATSRRALLEMLFGEHNLTSDAEGEVELLHVTRQKVMGLYANAKKIHDLYTSATCINTKESQQIDICKGVMSVLDTLFGSKCLPDNVESSEPNVDSSHGNVESLEPKPAKPKFKGGDLALVRGFKHPLLEHDGAIVTILSYHEKGDFYSCAIAPNVGIDVDAKYLEPYTVPTDFGKEVNFPTKKQSRNLSQNCDNRLQIAAMAMQGILSNIDLFKNVLETGTETLSGDDISFRAVAKASLLFADALMNEAEKGVEE